MKYKSLLFQSIVITIISIFVITACEKKSRVNPFDPSSDTDFTPQNVQVAQSGVTTVTLTWELEDALIQGFKIDRKVGSGEWQTDYAVLDADAREWSDDDILPSNMYYYRLYGYADENVSEAIEVNITPGFPGPTDLDAQPYLVNQVKLTWTDVASGEAGYKIDKRVGSTGDWVIGYGETGADAEEWIDSSAVLDNILYYRVYAYIGELVSGYDEDSVNLSFPAPTNLTAVQESVKKVTLSWDDNSDGEDGFVIEKHTSTEEWIVYDNVAGDISQWSDSTLAMNTETFYRVHAYKDSDLSGTVSASITPVFPAPSNLQVILNELATITLSWNDNSVGEDGFRIDRQVDGGTWAEGYQTVGTDVKEWTDTNGIEMGKQYAYRVTAFTTDNMSAAAEGSITNVVPVPENVMISQPDVSTLRLTWTDSCAWETGFRIDKKIGDGIWEEGHVTLPPDTQQWQDTSPVLGQTHSYRIMTLYNSHSSSASEVSLMADIPGVENLTVVPASPTELILNWEDKAAGEQGYKIERKVGASGTYGLYATLGADIESYSDTSVGQDLYSYKVYPYYGIYNSSQPVEGSYDMSTYGTPIVQTKVATDITANSAVSGGTVIDDIGVDVTARGVCWSLNSNPTIDDPNDEKSLDGGGIGNFDSNLTGLLPNRVYYYRAYAENSLNVGYGEEYTITTEGAPPSVITEPITNITHVSATSGGSITSDGGLPITAKGVCWSTSANPTTSNPHTSDGTGSADFVSQITNLSETTTYHVRAYAINSKGISYGNDISFTTNEEPVPVLNTWEPDGGILGDTWTWLEGSIHSNGHTITDYGFFVSSSDSTPDSNDIVVEGEGTIEDPTGYIPAGLSPDTLYYVRLWARVGTDYYYGDVETFRTRLFHYSHDEEKFSDWTVYGDKAWYEGLNGHYQSGDITHNETSGMRKYFNISNTKYTVRINIVVDTEENYDKFYFYRQDVGYYRVWSGSIGGSTFFIEITPDSNILEILFYYEKDGSVSVGEDCVVIQSISIYRGSSNDWD